MCGCCLTTVHGKGCRGRVDSHAERVEVRRARAGVAVHVQVWQCMCRCGAKRARVGVYALCSSVSLYEIKGNLERGV